MTVQEMIGTAELGFGLAVMLWGAMMYFRARRSLSSDVDEYVEHIEE